MVPDVSQIQGASLPEIREKEDLSFGLRHKTITIQQGFEKSPLVAEI